MMKHTSICLDEEKIAKIATTGKPMNAVINEAIDNYFSGVISVGEDRIKEEIKSLLFSGEMQAFFKNEVRDALLMAMSSYMKKVDRDEIKSALKAE